jgi:hypothetical protein
MPGSPPGPSGKGEYQPSVKDQTSALIATPKVAPTGSGAGLKYVHGKGVSFELQDAPFVCVPTTLAVISDDEMRVLAWLRGNKGEIIAAEADFQVDRRAIAAAIAWEALENVHSMSARAVGAGKEHVWRWSPRFDPAFPLVGLASTTDEGTWVKGVEDAGLLPPQARADRTKMLAKPKDAIRYVAATMDLIAMIYERSGSPGVCEPQIRLNPAILTNTYQGSDPEKWGERVKTIKPGEELKPGNLMALWYRNPRNQQFLEDAVGPTELAETSPPATDGCTGDYRDAGPQESAQVLEKARLYKDTPYKYGGDSKAGIDCSHLIWKAINDALPTANYEYMDTAGMSSDPAFRKLDVGENPVSGDIMLFAHHVGFYDASPPVAGRILLSAQGDQQKSLPGVTWGKPEWFAGTVTYLKVRIPCK